MRAVTAWTEDGKPILQCLIILGDLKTTIPLVIYGKDSIPETERWDVRRIGVEMPTTLDGEYDGTVLHPLAHKPVAVRVKYHAVLIALNEPGAVVPIAYYRQVDANVIEKPPEIFGGTSYPGPSRVKPS